MAVNANTPMGLQGRRRVDGMTANMQLRVYTVPASDTNVLRKGDPVVKSSGLADAAGTPSITLATTGARLTGAVVGFRPSPTIIANGGVRAAGTAELVLVQDDPEMLFEVQEDGTYGAGVGVALPTSVVGKNANLVVGPGFLMQSGWQLSSSSIGTGAGLQVNIVAFLDSADNVVGAPYAKLLVRINQHTETPASAGI